MDTDIDKTASVPADDSSSPQNQPAAVEKKKLSFEEWLHKLVRFSLKTACYLSLGSVAVALLCGIIFLIALSQIN